MIRLLSIIGLLSIAMPALASGDLADAYATWARLRDANTPITSFKDGTDFLNDHPGWPQEKIIRIRTEAAALFERPDAGQLAKFCADYPPVSGRGMVACARLEPNAAKQVAAIRQAWVQGDFNEDEEQRLLKTYGEKMLMRGDHTARMDRLLYEGKLIPAKRMLPLVPADRQNLFLVRMAFIANEKKAPRLLKALSGNQLHDPGIIFERIRWKQKHNDDDYADLLIAAPKSLPYPELWWPMRAAAARSAIATRNFGQAYALIVNHGDLRDEPLADALWLKGWLDLTHHHDAGAAYKEFFRLYISVSTPVSKARAAYWAARAAEKNGNGDIANEWLIKAARHPTVFYGQLAYAQLKPGAPLVLPSPPEPTSAERQQFEADERVTVIRSLAQTHDDKMRDLFLTALANHTTTPGGYRLLGDLAVQTGGPATGVEAAKLALRNNTILLNTGWPRTELPQGELGIEPALTLAITRQESQFDPNARSPANAFGFMQLLPGTAAHIAKRIDYPYSADMLGDPTTNLTLGSRYLGQLIDGFDGSYLLGIASYNAGPGTVRGWLKTMGRPPHPTEGAIDWLESIPYGETRNYVMRVLENVSIYRILDDPDRALALKKDLQR